MASSTVYGKGAKERMVPIGNRAKQALLRYVQLYRPQPAPCANQVFLAVDGHPLSWDAVGHIIECLTKRSGITRLHAPLLRHTNGLQYLLLGGDTKSLQLFLGQASPVMTHSYEQLKDEHVVAQHRKYCPADALVGRVRRFGKSKQNRSSVAPIPCWLQSSPRSRARQR